jgi:hypothetical protein
MELQICDKNWIPTFYLYAFLSLEHLHLNVFVFLGNLGNANYADQSNINHIKPCCYFMHHQVSYSTGHRMYDVTLRIILVIIDSAEKH